MKDANPRSRVFRFGTFELDTATGELTMEGKSRLRIRDQALQILTMLLEKPDELVTHEELRERLWSADTFVDFDHGLNASVNQIRNALGDSAGNPRFIQTLPRRGYRFIAPVQIVPNESPATSAHQELLIKPTAGVELSEPSQNRSSLLSDQEDLPAIPGGAARILFALIQLLYLGFYISSLARLPKVEFVLASFGKMSVVLFVVLIVTAAMGIPIRLYLFTAAAFNYSGLNTKFAKLFPLFLLLDELWALAPFLLVEQIGIGLAIACTAALLYLPFSQRSLLLMGFRSKSV